MGALAVRQAFELPRHTDESVVRLDTGSRVGNAKLARAA
jgi:hypothetical protein